MIGFKKDGHEEMTGFAHGVHAKLVKANKSFIRSRNILSKVDRI